MLDTDIPKSSNGRSAQAVVKRSDGCSGNVKFIFYQYLALYISWSGMGKRWLPLHPRLGMIFKKKERG